MQENSALGRALAMVRDLRTRCPWDRAQTRETLRPYLVEEVLELDHALGEAEVAPIRDELSDLLLHLAFQLVIAEERQEFTADDVAAGLERKMRRRHPHLFDLGDAEPWERIKRKERRGRTLAGIVPTLPPLLKAYRLQERAASVGFDWPDADGPATKVREELAEVEAELSRRAPARTRPRDGGDPNTPAPSPSDALVEEIGDLLFAVVNLARKCQFEAESLLQAATDKFVARFNEMEDRLRARGGKLGEATLEELDAIWEKIKKDSRS